MFSVQLSLISLIICNFHCILTINDPEFELPHRGCYYTNWSQYRKGIGKFTVSDIDPALCTYIVVAFGKIENFTLTTLEWNDEDTFQALVALKEENPLLKILLSIGGWTLSHQLVSVSSSKESRQHFSASAVKNLRYWELDGLDVDWEYPDSTLKTQYSAFLEDLRRAFDDEAKATGQPRLALAAAVHFTSDGGYDGLILNRTLDFVNLMAYDLHGAWKPDKVGHHAPLFKGPFGLQSKESVSALVKAWEHLGMEKSKIVVGLPMYGRGWQLTDSQQHRLGSSAKGAIVASRYTGESGAWPYYEICQKYRNDSATVIFNENIQAQYAYDEDYWIGFDDRLTIMAKTKWVKTHGLGGVYIWDLAQDDFSNTCGFGRFPLLTAIYDIMKGPRLSAARWPGTTFNTRPTVRVTAGITFSVAASTTKAITTTKPPLYTSTKLSTTKSSQMTTKQNRAVLPVTTSAQPQLVKSMLKPVENVCDKRFCTWNGPGSFAIGCCETSYCDCDAGMNAYDRECIGGLLYDAVGKFCNWRDNVDGCATRSAGAIA